MRLAVDELAGQPLATVNVDEYGPGFLLEQRLELPGRQGTRAFGRFGRGAAVLVLPIAFGGEQRSIRSSGAGSLMPRYFMLKDGIEPEKFFKRIAYSGAHDATAAWVQAGKADGGVLNASVWDKLVAAGKVDTSKVRVIATTPTYYDYNWTVRGTLDPALTEKIKAAFLALDPANPEHKAILDLQAASRFIETKPENYEGIEEAARAAGLLK